MKRACLIAFATVAVLVVAAATADFSDATPFAHQATDIRNTTGKQLIAAYRNSSLWQLEYTNSSSGDATYPSYDHAPYLIKLRGTRRQVAYDYAALAYQQTADTLNIFANAVYGPNKTKHALIYAFLDFVFEAWMKPHTPACFIEELDAMSQWATDNPALAAGLDGKTPDVVSRRMTTMADLPADLPNLIAAIEHSIFPPQLARHLDEIVRILEPLVHSCDAFGVWGSRTGGDVYASRNLDFNSDTGISKYKCIIVIDIVDENVSPTAIFCPGMLGLNAVAGLSKRGISTSEMNLDNSETTFLGVPFPLRLRYVLENAHDLRSAMAIWNSTNNTNSFNFLISSASPNDKLNAAYALETIASAPYTAVYGANSPVEAAATFDCGMPPNVHQSCSSWTWTVPPPHTGKVRIGFPLVDAVWRTNHAFHPVIMKTQESLFNNTVYRYVLIHDLFVSAQSLIIGEKQAVEIAATSGIKYSGEGKNFFSCEPSPSMNRGRHFGGDHVLSVVYVPAKGRAYVAWEHGRGETWRPAACSPYLRIDFQNEW